MPNADATGRLFHEQYSISDPSFCAAQVCVDFDRDGSRELIFASRSNGQIQQLNAADGRVKWTRSPEGLQQSVAAFDVDADGDFEILYTVSGPGRLYLLDGSGEVLGAYESGDHKLGNSPVVIDADGDRRLDGIFGSRSRYLVRINLHDLSPIKQRSGWSQCGCYTSAMDVDSDGRWDLFAGSGDDHRAKGVLHRYDAETLQSVWAYSTDDNASSADPVLVDIDADGQVEIVKSVDNYKGDDAHDAVYAFETDGSLLWRVDGLSGEDSPNVADLDGDGDVEIVGMTFGCEVYCLKRDGSSRWRRDLRPELDNDAHAYMAPILCDLDGDPELEVLAMTNGSISSVGAANEDGRPHGILFALDADGEILDRLDVGGPRYWGHAFACNIDDDAWLELVVSGSGGLDVIETRGFGPNTEHFQRRRTYQRLNVLPWAYDETYFIGRGERHNVVARTDNLVLAQDESSYAGSGRFVTELLTLPPGLRFTHMSFSADVPAATSLSANILDERGTVLVADVRSGAAVDVRRPVRLSFEFTTTNAGQTPRLDDYSLQFGR